MRSLGFADVPTGLLKRTKVGRGLEVDGIVEAAGTTGSASAQGQGAVTAPPAGGPQPGLDWKDFQKLLHSPEFGAMLDYTFNKHNSTYNIRVIKKALSLVTSGGITMEDVSAARTSFLVYEGELCSGIPRDTKAIASTLRVIISNFFAVVKLKRLLAKPFLQRN